MTNDYGNLELHKVLLSAMKDIDKICRENGLRYYLHAGTLLGAVNHKGFIPWDDDVDISMLPKDFYTFQKIVNRDYSDLYAIDTYDNTPSHFSKLNKLRICGATIRLSDGTEEPVFIDISIYHSAPDGKHSRWLQQKQLEFWDRIIGVKARRIIPTSIPSKMTIGLLAHISKKWIGHRIDSIMTRYDNTITQYYALMIHLLPNPYTGLSGYLNDFVPRCICENPQYIPFEDTQFMAYSDPHVDLVRRYGADYNKPYPEEKRVTKHGIVSYEISEALQKKITSPEDAQ